MCNLHQDLVAFLDSNAQERQMQGTGAVCHCDGISGTESLCYLGFELLDLGPLGNPARLKDLAYLFQLLAIKMGPKQWDF